MFFKKYAQLPIEMVFSFNKNIPLLLFAKVNVKKEKIKFCAGFYNGKIIAEDETLFALLKNEKVKKYLIQRDEKYFQTARFCRRGTNPNFFGSMGEFDVGSYCFFCEKLEDDWLTYNTLMRLSPEFPWNLHKLLKLKVGEFLDNNFRPTKKDEMAEFGEEGDFLSYCPFSWFENAENWGYVCDDGLLTYFYWLGVEREPFPKYTWLFPRQYAMALRNFYEYGRDDKKCGYWTEGNTINPFDFNWY